MSIVFTYDGGEGWIHLLDMLAKIEKHCVNGDPNPPADCLQWKREQRRRNLRLSEVIYGIDTDGSTVTGAGSGAGAMSAGGGVGQEELHNHRRLRRHTEETATYSADTEDAVVETDDPGFRFYYHDIIQELHGRSKLI
jgi:hypothetical protein